MAHGKINIKDFAKYALLFYNSYGEEISNKKLNKILYFVQGWHLAYFEEDIFSGETPEAWVYGPVYPEIYRKYKDNGNKSIDIEEKNTTDRKTLNKYLDSYKLSEDQKDFIDSVLKNYGKKSATELEFISHMQTPWVEARKGFKPYESSAQKISVDTIKEYFRSKIKK